MGPVIPGFDWDEAQTEDAIITESFEPVLDMYLRHPDWGADIEMQGYMAEILEKRHPRVLDKLRTLALRGQIDVVSFHYSDQLFLAYPAKAMEWSIELNKLVFERLGIPLSPVVFTQEGQFGEGMLRFMAPKGFSIGLLPRNLFRYQHRASAENPRPYYLHPHLNPPPSRGRSEDSPSPLEGEGSGGGAFVVVAGGGVNDSRIQVSWSFMNDGELMATNNLNPYLGTAFKYDPASVEKHEKSIQDNVDAGSKVSTVSGYIRRLSEIGVQPEPLPPVLDGDWQPDDTGNVHLWMGRGGVFANLERDNAILTANYRTYQKLLALESVLDRLPESSDKGERLLTVSALVEHLFATVSDATGWNPWKGEIEYAQSHDAQAQTYIKQAFDLVKKHGDKPAIDSETGQFVDATEPKPTAIEPLIDVAVESNRNWRTTWSSLGGELAELRLDVEAGGGRTLSLTFPRTLDRIVYSPALAEDTLVDYPLSLFDFESMALPLSNGLIGLDEGRYLIKDNTTVHVAAHISRKEPTVAFIDETASTDPFAWRFLMVEGSPDDALRFANRMNITPIVAFEPPRKKSSGCETVPEASHSLLPAFLVALFFLTVRHRVDRKCSISW